MAFNTKDLKVDVRKLSRMTPTQRTNAAKKGMVDDLLAAMTPTQIAALFPKYYAEQLPSMAGFDKATESITNRTKQQNTTDLSGGPTAAPYKAPVYKSDRPASPGEVSVVDKYLGRSPLATTTGNKAVDLIKKREGFISTPKWDVNALRVGYGSDTITKEDGTVVPVTAGMRVTQEDADRDLARRIPQFQQNGIIKYVGADAWNKLNPDTQAALTSLAYNYGSIAELTSLQKAIMTGDKQQIAQAVESYQTHNNGVNADRRREEAAMIANSVDEETTDTAQPEASQSPADVNPNAPETTSVGALPENAPQLGTNAASDVFIGDQDTQQEKITTKYDNIRENFPEEVDPQSDIWAQLDPELAAHRTHDPSVPGQLSQGVVDADTQKVGRDSLIAADATMKVMRKHGYTPRIARGGGGNNHSSNHGENRGANYSIDIAAYDAQGNEVTFGNLPEEVRLEATAAAQLASQKIRIGYSTTDTSAHIQGGDPNLPNDYWGYTEHGSGSKSDLVGPEAERFVKQWHQIEGLTQEEKDLALNNMLTPDPDPQTQAQAPASTTTAQTETQQPAVTAEPVTSPSAPSSVTEQAAPEQAAEQTAPEQVAPLPDTIDRTQTNPQNDVFVAERKPAAAPTETPAPAFTSGVANKDMGDIEELVPTDPKDDAQSSTGEPVEPVKVMSDKGLVATVRPDEGVQQQDNGQTRVVPQTQMNANEKVPQNAAKMNASPEKTQQRSMSTSPEDRNMSDPHTTPSFARAISRATKKDVSSHFGVA